MEKNLKKVEIKNGKINFVCLIDKCPNSCCGPFGGVQRGIDSIDGIEFSEIVITNSDSKKIIASGYSLYIELCGDKYYKMKLLEDGTCSAFINGRCAIHLVKPTICRAFPFYIDMFVGLCVTTTCPGFGAGWTNLDNLETEINSTKEMYDFWLSQTSERLDRRD